MILGLIQKFKNVNGKSLWLTFTLTLLVFFVAPIHFFGYNPLSAMRTIIFLASIFTFSLVLVSDKKETEFNSFTSIVFVILLSFQ